MSITLMPLHDLAHARTGDKGNRINISLIAYKPAIWPVLLAEVTQERVARLFAMRGTVSVLRYALPNLHALNFVIDDVLEGGVNASLNLDTHGKTLAFLLLSDQIFVPDHIRNELGQP